MLNFYNRDQVSLRGVDFHTEGERVLTQDAHFGGRRAIPAMTAHASGLSGNRGPCSQTHGPPRGQWPGKAGPCTRRNGAQMFLGRCPWHISISAPPLRPLTVFSHLGWAWVKHRSNYKTQDAGRRTLGTAPANCFHFSAHSEEKGRKRER